MATMCTILIAPHVLLVPMKRDLQMNTLVLLLKDGEVVGCVLRMDTE